MAIRNPLFEIITHKRVVYHLVYNLDTDCNEVHLITESYHYKNSDKDQIRVTLKKTFDSSISNEDCLIWMIGNALLPYTCCGEFDARIIALNELHENLEKKAMDALLGIEPKGADKKWHGK
jgi:hypothetical protein